jgi:hypothetical protein
MPALPRPCPTRPTRRVRLVALALAATVAAAVGALSLSVGPATASPARATTATPPSRHSGSPIEGFASYQPQFFCRSSVEPGVTAFEKLVLATYPATHSDGDMRACGVAGTSEHKDGRAWDWGADHRVASQRADGQAVLRWLFAPDSAGNPDAMFRRLGLMYIIWNKRIWGAWDQSWQPYSCSGVTLCHVDHIHFSFGWAGAEKLTSYWTGSTTGVVEPPLSPFTSTTAPKHLRVSATAGTSYAHWLLSRGDHYVVRARGVWRDGTRSTAQADARCTRTSSGWVPSTGSPGALSVSGDQLPGWGEQWVPTHDSGNGCNTATHTYRLALAPTASTTVQATLPDSSSHDDSGSVTLRFTRTG